MLNTFDNLNQRRELPEQIFRREKRWMTSSYGYFNYFSFMIRFRTFKPELLGMPDAVDKFDSQLETIRKLQIRIASHAFKLSNGRAPINAKELVPKFLKEIPTHPKMSTPLVLEQSP